METPCSLYTAQPPILPGRSALSGEREREREQQQQMRAAEEGSIAMAIGVFHSVSGLLAAWRRHVSRMSRKLLSAGGHRGIDPAEIAPSWAPYLSRRVSLMPFLSCGNKKSLDNEKRRRQRRGSEDYEDVEGVWRRAILMGEKCEPLDFSGVIYYDAEGNRLPELPQRSPLRSPPPSLSFPVVAISSQKRGI